LGKAIHDEAAAVGFLAIKAVDEHVVEDKTRRCDCGCVENVRGSGTRAQVAMTYRQVSDDDVAHVLHVYNDAIFRAVPDKTGTEPAAAALDAEFPARDGQGASDPIAPERQIGHGAAPRTCRGNDGGLYRGRIIGAPITDCPEIAPCVKYATVFSGAFIEGPTSGRAGPMRNLSDRVLENMRGCRRRQQFRAHRSGYVGQNQSLPGTADAHGRRAAGGRLFEHTVEHQHRRARQVDGAVGCGPIHHATILDDQWSHDRAGQQEHL